MRFSRAAGVLLHPTSLPGRFGIGDLGPRAYQFVDFLVDAGQSLWQLLPLGPTGYADSPYQSFSAFAGNPLLISPEHLVRDGYLPAEAIVNAPTFPSNRVDYGPAIQLKEQLLAGAHDRFLTGARPEQADAFHAFCAAEADWLDDYALFMACKSFHIDQDGGVWNTWPAEIAFRTPEGLQDWSDQLAPGIVRYKFYQFLFFEQWLALKHYANDKGIRIIGDAPIFVAYDSADVWANPGLFHLLPDGSPEFVAGVPPDYFSETGQRWGNPLYRWDEMAKDDYAWWVRRLQMALRQLDIVRIDHFRGFEAYWEIPAAEPTAVLGQWVKGPAEQLFLSLQQQLGDLPIIAEDLGVITPEVEALRDQFGFPGMKILQFAFGGEHNSSFLPHNYSTPNCVVYTGTHDNETTSGWYRSAEPREQDYVRRYLAIDGRDVAWDMIRLAYMSIADIAVIPMQDLLNLGNEARMNFPSVESGNWQWRMTPEMISPRLAYRLEEMTRLYGRSPVEPDIV